MPGEIHIDVETYSSEDLKKVGAYKYFESPDFEILMIAYSIGDGPIKIIDVASGQKYPDEFICCMDDPDVIKIAHNATFERLAFLNSGIDVPIEQWECTLVKAAYCGFPLSLGMVSKAMGLESDKDSAGTSLINYFSKPVKPTKTNGGRTRNLPDHDLIKWRDFKNYCKMDVQVEKEIHERLREIPFPKMERDMYILDQKINDRGILMDHKFIRSALVIDDYRFSDLMRRMKKLTGLENPNSTSQLRDWLSNAMKENITTLAKDELPDMIERAGDDAVKKVIELRMRSSKSSIKKYVAMENCEGSDRRARGLFQYYGANRTGRWSGRLIQLQNLPRIKMDGLEQAKKLISMADPEIAEMAYPNISSTLSQLIRTAFISKEGHILCVSDFSAIEARVIAWLAGEKWRMDVFRSHGMIYEASASMMFGVPLKDITKDLRVRGKVAELALGYQGSLGAMIKMGAMDMGLTETEIRDIVKKWRRKSPHIVALWKSVERACITAIRRKGTKITLTRFQNIKFLHDGKALRITLPSGRDLFYQEAKLSINQFDNTSTKYKGMDIKTRRWWWVDSYGGKFVENIVQAIARDILAYAMLRLEEEGFPIVMHVHDEVVAEIIPSEDPQRDLDRMNEIMSEDIPWAPGLPLKAAGYHSKFYKKD